MPPRKPSAVGSHVPTSGGLVKALARAFRWKRMLESGEFSSISELAEKEGIAFTYMARLMRMSLLSSSAIRQHSSSIASMPPLKSVASEM